MKNTKTLKQMQALYIKAKNAYYNTDTPILHDDEFDELENTLKVQCPDWDELKATGIATKKNKARLPFYMPSLDKSYPPDLPKWLERIARMALRRPTAFYTVTDKLDGTALLLGYVNGKPRYLYTRGDGITGGDVSYLIPYLRIPKRLSPSESEEVWLRCEGVMNEKNFKKRWSTKVNKNGFDNSRAAANGQFNRSLSAINKEALLDVSIVVLSVLDETLAAGLAFAKAQGFTVVDSKKVAASEMTAEAMAALLAEKRKHSPYNMDGLVIVPQSQVISYASNNRPKWATAFKENLDANSVEAKVLRIVWQVSSFGRFTPKIEIKPVDFGGVVVTYATAHNAKWMVDREIGPGAIVKLVRSGDVIPKIVGVVKPGKLQMPEQEHVWKGVHVVSSGDDEETKRKRTVLRMLRFLRNVGIENVAAKGLTKMYDLGITNPVKLYSLKGPAKLIEALGDANGKKLWTAMQTTELHLADVMVASSMFDEGVGKRRINEVAKHITLGAFIREPNWDWLYTNLERLHGFGDATATLIVEGGKRFLPFYKALSAVTDITVPRTITMPKKRPKGRFSGMKAAWTGYRDPAQEATFKHHGGEVAAFSASCTHLFYKDGGKKSSKIAKAGSKAMTWDEFAVKTGIRNSVGNG